MVKLLNKDECSQCKMRDHFANVVDKNHKRELRQIKINYAIYYTFCAMLLAFVHFYWWK